MRSALIVFYSAFIAVVALIALTSKSDSHDKKVRTLCDNIDCILKREGK